MVNCWTNQKKKEQKGSCPLCHSSCSLYLVGEVAVPLLCPRRCPEQEGGRNVGWIWVSSAAVSPTASLICFFPNFVCPALRRRISKVSVPWPLIISGFWITNNSLGRNITKLPDLSLQRFNFVCFSFCSNNSTECTNLLLYEVGGNIGKYKW